VNKVGHRLIGLLELAGEAGRCDDIAGAPDPGAGALPRIWRTFSCKAYVLYMPEGM